MFVTCSWFPWPFSVSIRDEVKAHCGLLPASRIFLRAAATNERRLTDECRGRARGERSNCRSPRSQPDSWRRCIRLHLARLLARSWYALQGVSDQPADKSSVIPPFLRDFSRYSPNPLQWSSSFQRPAARAAEWRPIVTPP